MSNLMLDDNKELTINILLESSEEEKEPKKYFEGEIWEPKHEVFFDIEYLSEIRFEITTLRTKKDDPVAQAIIKTGKRKKVPHFSRFFFWIGRILFGWKDFIDTGIAFPVEDKIDISRKFKHLEEQVTYQPSEESPKPIKKLDLKFDIEKQETPFQQFLKSSGIFRSWIKLKKIFLHSPYILSIDIEPGWVSYIVQFNDNIIEQFGIFDWKKDETAKQEMQKESIKKALRKIAASNFFELSDVVITLGTVEPKIWIERLPKVAPKELEQLIQFHISKTLGEAAASSRVEHSIIGTEEEKGVEKAIIGFAALNNLNIQEILTSCNEEEIEPQSLAPSSISLLNYIKRFESSLVEDGLIVLDIGSDASLIFIVMRGFISIIRQIPIGDEHFKNAFIGSYATPKGEVAVDKNLSEKLKAQYGIPDSASAIPIEKDLLLGQLGKVIQPLEERFLTEINRTLEYFHSQLPDIKLHRMVLTGPGSQIVHLPDILAKSMDMEIRLFSTPPNLYLGPGIEDESTFLQNYQWFLRPLSAANSLHEEIDFLAGYGHNQKKEATVWLGIGIAGLLICIILVLFSFSILHTMNNMETKLSQLQSQTNLLSVEQKDYLALIQKKDAEQGQDSKFIRDMNVVNQHISTSGVLKMVSNLIPQGISLSKLEYITTNDSLTQSDHIRIEGNIDPDYKGSVSDLLVNFFLSVEKYPLFVRVEIPKGRPESETKEDTAFELICHLRPLNRGSN
ncbi:MAG: cell division FtsA domain-containing protein [Patescibacteria group bacterium]|nr:cell division FtsA domain-containing protein [Patescibacteria group bacterium]